MLICPKKEKGVEKGAEIQCGQFGQLQHWASADNGIKTEL